MIARILQVPAETLRVLAGRWPGRYPLLLDTVAPSPTCRYSLLLAEPQAALWLDARGRLGGEGLPLGLLRPHAGFLETLERWWLAERTGPTAVPYCGGWAVYLGYELAAQIEPRLVLPRAQYPWTALALRCPCALVYDHHTGLMQLYAEPRAAGSLERIEADARWAADERRAPAAQPPVAAVHEQAPQVFLQQVHAALAHIGAGEVYQINLSRAWDIRLRAEQSLGDLYERLRAANPAPFAAWAQWRGASILSSSPERLVRIGDGRVQTRPIAGTRARAAPPGRDAEERAALAAHPKERAEHIMLIDLERNDLGRVCQPGTVCVEDLMTIESYRHVHHIVSGVSGRLRPELTPIAALRAVFPGGTITGCPKFRCMQLIAELEGEGRGPYTGSLGWLGRDGRADFNILIRTLWAQGTRAQLRAGAGIVADSDPQRELAETRAKARGVLAALGSVPGEAAA